MKVKLSLLRPGNELVDLVITAEPTTPISELARELYNADPNRTGPTIAEGAMVGLQLHDRAPTGGLALGRLLHAKANLGESGLVNGSIASVVSDAPDQAQREVAVGAIVTAVEGPDRGRTWNLPVGSSVLGRDPGVSLQINDPLVSKTHARLSITDVAEVIDVGSANGTFVNELQVDRAVLAPADRIQIGDTVLTVSVSATASRQIPASVLQFNRSPRIDAVFDEVTIAAPEVPERPEAHSLPVVALLAPLVLGIAAFMIAPDSILSLVMLAATPVLLVAGFADSVIRARRTWKGARAEFDASTGDVREQITALHAQERVAREVESPAVATIVSSAVDRTSMLWTRRPEHESFLSVRLGVGRVDSRVHLQMPTQRKGSAGLWTELEALAAFAADVGEVPVIENFRSSGGIGVAGPVDRARGIARGIVAQLAGLHSPAELSLVAVASASSAVEWDWLKWLPHVGSPLSPLKAGVLAPGGLSAIALLAEVDEIIAQRRARVDRHEESAVLPAIVLVVDDDTQVDRARLVSIAERGPVAGVHVLWVAGAIERLPAACRTYVHIDPASGVASVGYVHESKDVAPIACEELSAAEALALSRSLAPVEDAGARAEDSSDFPRSVSLLSLLGTELAADPASVIGRWNETNSILTGPYASGAVGKTTSNLRAVFGQGASEPLAIDLRTDGPHGLVGGTTGSGKSEFLQAWVLGLAAAHSPQRVTFLLVDYKGGAAFADCVNLPHTVGLVTDLSPHLVRRALTSLRAEIRYREHLFNRKKVKDLVEFERTGDPQVPPSLVIVIDEFAALATEMPEFVDGVIDIAQRGRSLGLHLVLATQRPAGVIRDNLRANTNLRIALRMADTADSEDVLGDPIAAGFDSSLPGRGAVKTGPGRLRVFQTGYAGGWTTDAHHAAEVVIEELRFGPLSAWPRIVDTAAEERKAKAIEGPTDIERIVRNVGEANAVAQIPRPRQPWLPVLAPAYDFAKLPNRRTDAELVIGVLDDPAQQTQPAATIVPDRDGNVAIIGAGGSGKSTALRTVAIAAAVTVRGGPVQVYGLDFGAGGLRMLEALPHVGSIIAGDDDERVVRLLRWLRDLVDDRATRFAEARAGSLEEYRRIANRPAEARILLLVDGITAFRDAYESSPTGVPWFAAFSQIATDGRQVGVHVIATGDRAGAVPASLSSSFQRRIVLRMASQDDYGVMGVPNDILSPASPPGRAIFDDREMQLASLGGDSNLALQSREVDQLAQAMIDAGVTSAPSIERLGSDIALRDLPASLGGLPVVGLADDTLMPIAFEPTGPFVVAGPGGSGRSTAVSTIIVALRRAHPDIAVLVLSPRRSELGGTPAGVALAEGIDASGTLIDATLDRLRASATPASTALLIENIAEFVDSAVETKLATLVREVLAAGGLVVGEAETSAWAGAFPFNRMLRVGRRGLMLQPDVGDEELLKTTFGRIVRGFTPPGRGYLVTAGRARKVQIASAEVEL